MRRRSRTRAALILTLGLAVAPTAGCDDGDAGATASDAAAAGGGASGEGGAGGDGAVGGGGTAVDQEATAIIAHGFPHFELEPFQEFSECVSWTMNNETALYIERFEIENDGAWHHSNWFAVPEEMFEGPDGFWNCASRDFGEVEAAAAGVVLGAQSTQSYYEAQFIAPGVVTKIPPRHKVVAGAHMLNLAARPVTTQMRIRLHAIHPARVKTVMAPFRVTYYDLSIVPESESRFTARCMFREPYESVARVPLDLKLYWLLPHTHELGNFFEVKVIGGPRDGEVLLRLDGFDAEGHGKAFDPPVDFSDAEGIEVTCGYQNPRPVEVGWGIGDQEMCEMLGMADARLLMDMAVREDGAPVEPSPVDGIPHFTGPCTFLTVPKPEAQQPPTDEEKNAPLAVPESDPDVRSSGGPPECVDTPADAASLTEPSVERMGGYIFRPSCSYSSCHGGPTPSAGLDLMAEDLEAELLGHTTASGAPLVRPGDAANSPLYQRISECSPEGGAHMPLNAPTLMEPALVAMVRDWINALPAQ
jgi:hypothetical protein